MRRIQFFFVCLLNISVPLYADSIDTGAQRLTKVGNGIYAVEPVFAGANAAVIINDEFVTVVDTHGSPASATALVDAIRGLTDRPVRYVINSHWHVDHHSGNSAYEAAWPGSAQFISHRTTRDDIPGLGRGQYDDTAAYRTLPIDAATKQLDEGIDSHGAPLTSAQRADIERFRSNQERFVNAAPPFVFRLADLTLERRLTLHGTPHDVEIMHLYPAHTRGDLVVWLPASRVLIVSDILTQPILWTWSSHPRDYVRTLAALEALNPETILIGHGGPVLTGTEYLATARGFLQAVIDSLAGLDMSVTEEMAIAVALENEAVRRFHARFGGDELDPGMFNQMVSWTASRAWLEQRGEL